MSTVFEAKYPGWCICCEDRINEGDNVHYQDDTIVHDGCQIIRDPLAPSKTVPLTGTEVQRERASVS
jgi:hypothetical protein